MTKSYFPLLIHFKLNVRSLLFNRHRKEYVRGRILFNSGLPSYFKTSGSNGNPELHSTPEGKMIDIFMSCI